MRSHDHSYQSSDSEVRYFVGVLIRPWSVFVCMVYESRDSEGVPMALNQHDVDIIDAQRWLIQTCITIHEQDHDILLEDCRNPICVSLADLARKIQTRKSKCGR